ncbi:TetR/AcrR family transcriptional regulator [Nocardia terpenica]|uniref:TetR family transcriptional regulator n=1 Tax=Nocardia terpenica TaxID=455432 RepID=A0A164JDR7_9NOCA|nr:TetR/AcrR family transcriptional regulator [Nocardia terpenica]KZM70302.1 TetR family transcriptional regulator [Nocardia terpenica]NQE91463.1 TetR/AcrR family transcriptional regulator [Nocardia terpenica]
MTIEAGLRETKKRETRQSISDHATRLFIAHGFEATTIAEIADAARVAKKTVTNYFPRKEDLALDYHNEFAASLATTVTARAPGESALTALRREFDRAATAYEAVAGFTSPGFCRMITNSPTLTARLRELHELREQALAQALPGTELTRRAAATQLASAHRLLFQRVQELTLERRSRQRIADTARAEATYIFDLLEPALGDYAIA